MTPPGRSNWGRWGENDELGALNLLDATAVLAALSIVKTGDMYSLALPIQPKGGPVLGERAPVLHFMALDGGDYAAGVKLPTNASIADDYVVMPTHTSTHIDALSHVWTDGQMYNGFSGTEVRSSGAAKLGIEKTRPILARGILLDAAAQHGPSGPEPGYRITAADLERCEKEQGVRVDAANVVLVRTGWLHAFANDRARYAESWPGIDVSVVDWCAERDVVALCTDGGVEPRPAPPDAPFGVHVGLIRNLGIYLLELVYMEELAAREIYEFLFIASPLKIKRAVGSPVNPIAIT
jgi:kynurenine formamidase